MADLDPREPDGLATGPMDNFRDVEQAPSRGATRYAGYLRGAAAIFVKFNRYLAYFSEVGEAFRPVLDPAWVKASYGVTWAYIVGDVSWHAWQTNNEGGSRSEVAEVVGRTATFQVLGSLLLPVAIIHLGVHGAQKILPRLTRSARVRKYAPTAFGLSLIPGMPIVDEPVEGLVDTVFDVGVHGQPWPPEFWAYRSPEVLGSAAASGYA
mmetsp:Transcript_32174/g.77098  ORF Transcript_32174/g.77098 Transcript_32174/m.77098 type:complete len:209 (+) Transcript_32174:24-650(+)